MGCLRCVGSRNEGRIRLIGTARDGPLDDIQGGDSGQRGTSATFPRCGKRLQRRGPRLVGKSDEYRRYARECLEMASAVSDPRARASLLQMAQVWFRLADRMPADATQVEG